MALTRLPFLFDVVAQPRHILSYSLNPSDHVINFLLQGFVVNLAILQQCMMSQRIHLFILSHIQKLDEQSCNQLGTLTGTFAFSSGLKFRT
jgi:hypothetical protein